MTFKNRQGFTLIEALVAVTLSAIVIGIATGFLIIGVKGRAEMLGRGSVLSSAVQVDEVLRRDIEGAGRRMFSTYNLSGVHVQTGDSDGVPMDTLTLLSARGRALSNSTKECVKGATGSCMVLMGDVRDELSPGALVITGSPQTGGRVLQVVAADTTIQPCGADCAAESVTITKTAVGDILGTVITGSIRWKIEPVSGDTIRQVSADPCPPPEENPEWQCTERTQTAKIGDQFSVTTQQQSGAPRLYTEVSYIDRTSAFGYPSAATWTSRSGASGIPAIKTQEIVFSRYYVDSKRNPSQPTLMRVSTITEDGEFGVPEPVALGVASFEVMTTHSNPAQLYRGVGITSDSLAFSAANSNYVAAAPSTNKMERSYSFKRSYMTVSSVRVEYTVEDVQNSEGSVAVKASIPMSLVSATPHLLDGGVIDTRMTDFGYASSTIDDSLAWNSPPIARLALSPSPAEVGEPVTFINNGSSDPDGEIVNYALDFGDGVAINLGATFIQETHAFTTAGTYYPTLTVIDDYGQQGQHVVELVVLPKNIPPVASFTLPQNPTTGVWLSFVSTSSDADGQIVKTEWSFSDGQTAEGKVASAMFSTGGSYSVTLRVTDDRGAVSEHTESFTVASGNTPPVAVITPPACVTTPGYCQAGTEYIWSATNSNDLDGEIQSYSWLWGDGTGAAGVSVGKTFVEGGAYEVTLTVRDDEGGESSVTQSVLVNSRPVAVLHTPECVTSPEGCYAGVPYTFDASNSYDPDGTITGYELLLGDGSRVTAPVSPYTYSVPGVYTITLNVTDDRGNTGTTSVDVVVNSDERPTVTCSDLNIAVGASGAVSCSVTNNQAVGAQFDFTATAENPTLVTVASPPSVNIPAGGTVQVDVPVSASATRNGVTAITLRAQSGNQVGEGSATISIDVAYGVSITEESVSPRATSFELRSWGYDQDGPRGHIRYASESYSCQESGWGRGIHVLVIDKATGEVDLCQRYDTHVSSDDADALAELLEDLGKGKLVFAVSHGAWEGQVTERLRHALYRHGLGYARYPYDSGDRYRQPYSFVIDSDNNQNSREALGERYGSDYAEIRGVLGDGKLYGSNRLEVGEAGRMGISITNLSDISTVIDLSLTCSGEVDRCLLTNESGGQIVSIGPLGPGESHSALVHYEGANVGEGNVVIVATAGEVADTLSRIITVGPTTARPPPVITSPGDFSAHPGDRGVRSVVVSNFYKYGRQFSLSYTSSETDALTVDGGEAIWLEPFSERTIDIEYAVPDQALEDETSTYGIIVSDSETSASATGTFTVEGTHKEPVVIAPASLTVQPSEAGTVTFYVKNPSNGRRTYSLDVNTSGIVTNGSSSATVTVEAFDSSAVSVGYVVSSIALEGEEGTLELTASDGSLSDTDATTLVIGLARKPPTVTGPTSFFADPGEEGSTPFAITNNSNGKVSFTLTTERSGAVASALTETNVIELDVGETRTVSVRWFISPTANEGETGTFKLIASDGVVSGEHEVRVTATDPKYRPHVYAPEPFMVKAASVDTAYFEVESFSQTSQTIVLIPTASGVVTSANVIGGSAQGFGAFERRVVGVQFTVSNTALPDATGVIDLGATFSYTGASGRDAVTVTTDTTRIAPTVSTITDRSRAPGANESITYHVKNNSNFTERLCFSVASSDTDVVTILESFSCRDFAPFEVRTVSFDYSVADPKPAYNYSDITFRTWIEDDPSHSDSDTFRVTVALVEKAPSIVVDHGDHDIRTSTSYPQEIVVTNNTNEPRSIRVGLDYDGPNGVPTAGYPHEAMLPWSPGTITLDLGPYESRSFTETLTTKDQVEAGTAVKIKWWAVDLTNTSLRGSHIHNVTQVLEEASPSIVVDHDDHPINTSTTYNQKITVTNNTNEARQITIDLQYGSIGGGLAAEVAARDTSIANVPFAAYETRTFDAWVRTRSQLVAGTTAEIQWLAYDVSKSSSLRKAHSHTVTVALELAAPTITGPGDQRGVPGERKDLVWTITNNSNAEREFYFGNSSSNHAVMADPVNPPNITIPAYGTDTIWQSYQIKDDAIAGSQSTFTMSVWDYRLLKSHHQHTVTTDSVQAHARMWGGHSAHNVDPGAVYIDTVWVQNMANFTQVLRVDGYEAGEVYELLEDSGPDPGLVTFGPYEIKSFVFINKIKSEVPAGLTKRVTYRAWYNYAEGCENECKTWLSHDITANNSAPVAPSGLTVTPTGVSSIQVTWVDNSVIETGYQLQRSTDNGVTWTTLVELGPNITSYSDTGLSEATRYSYRVRAYQEYQGSREYSAFSSAQGAQTHTRAPNTPSGLSVSVVSANRLDLSWTDNSSNETGFQVQRSLNGTSGWTTIGTLSANSTSWSNVGLSEATTYYYRIRAVRTVNGQTAYSAWSNVASNTTSTNTPSAPSGLSVSVVSASSLRLNWTDNSNNESGFQVQRSPNGSSSWSTVASSLSAGTTTWTNSGLSESTTYYYRVRAFRTVNGQTSYSGWSNVASNTTSTDAPSAPSGLSVSVVSSSSLRLNWTDNSSDETGFQVQRSPNGSSSWTTVASSLAAGTTTWTNSSLSEATTYYYRVRSFRTVNGQTAYSAWSNVASNTTSTNTPSAPSGLSVSVVSASSLRLNWTDNSSNETGFQVQRSPDGSSGWATVSSSLSAGTTTWTNSGLSEATRYYYRVRAFRTVNGQTSYSSWSNVANNITSTNTPSAPSGLSVSVVSSSSLRLNWTDNSSNETGFQVQRSPNGSSSWSTVASSLGAGTTTWSNSGLSEATRYYYRVRAFRTVNGQTSYSSWSNVANNITSTNTPSAPSGLSVSTLSSSELRLSWSDNSNNESGFQVQRSPNGSSSWSTVASSLSAGTTSWTNSGLTESTTYYYRVRAFRTVNSQTSYSGWSNVANGTTEASIVTAAPSVWARFTTFVMEANSSSSIYFDVINNSSYRTSICFTVTVSGNGLMQPANPASVTLDGGASTVVSIVLNSYSVVYAKARVTLRGYLCDDSSYYGMDVTEVEIYNPCGEADVCSAPMLFASPNASVRSDDLLPAPDLTCDRAAALVGEPLTCTTYTHESNISYHRFDWGDGQSSSLAGGEEARAVHHYSQEGTYTVAAYVIGNNGASSAYRTTEVEIAENTAPAMPYVAVPSAPLYVGDPIRLDIDAFDPDAELYGDYVRALYVDLGDGRAAWLSGDEPLIIAYDAPGSFLVSVTAYDKAGAASMPARHILNVRSSSVPALACQAPETVIVGEPVGFTAEFSGRKPLEHIEIEINDGEPIYIGASLSDAVSGSFHVEHTYSAVGRHSYTCSVRDTENNVYEWTGTLDVVDDAV